MAELQATEIPRELGELAEELPLAHSHTVALLEIGRSLAAHRRNAGRPPPHVEAGLGAALQGCGAVSGFRARPGGGEVAVTDSRGDTQRRYVVRAASRAEPAKVTVRHAKRGAKVVIGRNVEEDLLYGRATSHRSRAEALERARSHLANHYGGGEIEIQNPAGTVIGHEAVPAPEWWLGDETAPSGSGDGQ